MTGKKKYIIVLAVVVVSFVVIITAFLLFFINTDASRKSFERAVSGSTGFDFRINGRLGLVLFPRFGISAGDVRMSRDGVHVLSAEKIEVGLDLAPLLRRTVSITEFAIVEPSVTVERDAQGRFSSFRKSHNASRDGMSPPVPISMGRLKISGGDILFIDRRSDTSIEIRGIDLTINGVSLKTEEQAELVRNVSFTGSGRCAVLKSGEFRVEDVAFSMKAGDGVVNFEPVTMDFFGSRGAGTVLADFTKKSPSMSVRFSASQFSIDEAFAATSKRQIVKGRMDLLLDVVAEGKGLEEMKKRAKGTVVVQGEDLVLEGLDIDGLIADINNSRSMTMLDAAAFSLAGPLGIALSKGSDLANVYIETRGGRGTIRKLNSAWNIQSGTASAQDVAFATAKNRIAIQGRIDFVNRRYDEITVAVLDEQGCPSFSQKIRGPFENPEIDKVSTVMSAAGSVARIFFETTQRLTGSGGCRVFYSGSVRHPNGK